ncbi:hypothetical protein ABZX72_01260 [Streptomyces cyaneofuscatus]|uniref:hypothetical protein n=1 Tax=Streptomyces cyaneofuscatus TaxID=66883 RepID=UPI0033B4597A
MSSNPEVLAWRGSDDPSDWAGVAVIMVLYLLIGYGLEYRAKKRRGAERPAKAAAEGLFSERQGGMVAAPEQHFASRMVMMFGALAAGLAGFLTRGAPTGVHYAVMGGVALLGIFAWAYFDHRTEPRTNSEEWKQP